MQWQEKLALMRKDIERLFTPKEIMKLRFELIIDVMILGDKNDPGKGTQTRKRKVLAVGVAGGSVCEKKDETENKVCQPCVQEGNIHIFKSNSPIFKIA